MKKLNQKQWGILGTSLGSVLIIVALLTMVGIGSGDTYATTTTSCICPEGYTHKANTSICTKTVTESYSCCSGLSCKEHTGVDYCSSTEGCSLTSTKEVGLGSTKHTVSVYSCSKTTTTTQPCEYKKDDGIPECSAAIKNGIGATCPTENNPTTIVSAGTTCANATCSGVQSCSINGNIGTYKTCTYNKSDTNIETCPEGEYRAAGDCVTCPQGSYCPGGSDSTRHDCPPDKPKSKAGSTSRIDCVASDSNPNRITCEAGTYYTGATKKCETCLSGYYCPGTSLPANTTLQGTDGIFKCPTDRPYSSSGAKLETDCLASGNGGSGGGGSSGGGSGGSGGSGSGGSSGGNSGGSSGGNSGGSTGGNNSNTNTNPNTATKTPLVIVIIGMVSMGLGTFTYYKGKNNEI